MSDPNKTENNQDKKKKKPTYWEKIIYGKGTIAEPWPTGEELWNDPEVQKAIQAHNASVRAERISQNKKNKVIINIEFS